MKTAVSVCGAPCTLLWLADEKDWLTRRGRERWRVWIKCRILLITSFARMYANYIYIHDFQNKK